MGVGVGKNFLLATTILDIGESRGHPGQRAAVCVARLCSSSDKVQNAATGPESFRFSFLK